MTILQHMVSLFIVLVLAAIACCSVLLLMMAKTHSFVDYCSFISVYCITGFPFCNCQSCNNEKQIDKNCQLKPIKSLSMVISISIAHLSVQFYVLVCKQHKMIQSVRKNNTDNHD